MVLCPDAKSVLLKMQDTIEFYNVELTDVNQKGISGNTPLGLAVAWEDFSIVKLLLDAGADVNAILEDNQTPLHEAARIGNSLIAALLVERGARLDTRNDFGRTPAETARVYEHRELAEFLETKT